MITYAKMQTLHTPRLILRKLEMGDLPLYFSRLGSSEAVTRYMLWEPHKDIRESEASIQKALARYETGTGYRWAITLKEDSSLIGIIDLLRFQEDSGVCSFAYMLAQDFWGRGYGTEAVKAVFRFGFCQLGLEAIEADHMSANPASGAVMRKAGMCRQRALPGKYEKRGVRYDAEEYRITKEEWTMQQED